MGIGISERTETFHIPYGELNNDGTPETRFVDVKEYPEWIPVLPSCVGWPETQELLQAVNSPKSLLMTLAADQGITSYSSSSSHLVLTSFVTLCWADISRNEKGAIMAFANLLQNRTQSLIQQLTNAMQRTLHLDIVLEIQPTVFHNHGVTAWSLSILMAAPGEDAGDVRRTWGLGMQVLQLVLTEQGSPG